jgi:hypothetical protein
MRLGKHTEECRQPGQPSGRLGGFFSLAVCGERANPLFQPERTLCFNPSEGGQS